MPKKRLFHFRGFARCGVVVCGELTYASGKGYACDGCGVALTDLWDHTYQAVLFSEGEGMSLPIRKWCTLCNSEVPVEGCRPGQRFCNNCSDPRGIGVEDER